MADASDNLLPTRQTAQIASVPYVADANPLNDPQTQPRVMGRQIPSSVLRGTQLLGSGNVTVDASNSKITVSDGTVTRIIMGLLPDGSYGMVVSKPGIDVADVFK